MSRAHGRRPALGANPSPCHGAPTRGHPGAVPRRAAAGAATSSLSPISVTRGNFLARHNSSEKFTAHPGATDGAAHSMSASRASSRRRLLGCRTWSWSLHPASFLFSAREGAGGDALAQQPPAQPVLSAMGSSASSRHTELLPAWLCPPPRSSSQSIPVVSGQDPSGKERG